MFSEPVLFSPMLSQQLKDQALLNGWLRDGSPDYVGSLCGWG